jgi:hypothetical protein
LEIFFWHNAGVRFSDYRIFPQERVHMVDTDGVGGIGSQPKAGPNISDLSSSSSAFVSARPAVPSIHTGRYGGNFGDSNPQAVEFETMEELNKKTKRHL